MNKVNSSLTKTVRLGTLADFRNGINYNKDNFGKGIRVINVKDFQDYSVAKFDDLGEINPDGVIREESLLKNGDIIFVRSNGNRELIGRSMIINDVPGPISHSAFSIKVRFNSPKVLPRFYAYLFRTQLIRQVLSAQGGGTNIANLNQTILNNLEVPCPPLALQRKIASILSAYDDLIENNTRRIAILEEMAQAIYREWFVNFRFPGHENVKLVDSPLGQIPEGWDVVTLKEMYPTSSGGTPSRKKDEYYNGGTINWVKTKELKDRFLWDTEEKITELGLQKSSAKVYPQHTVIMAMYGATIGQLGILGANASTNQACCAFRVHDSEYGYPFIFSYLLYNRTDVIGLRSGAAQQNVSQDVIREIEIARPPVGLVDQFDAVATPTLELMFNLQKANHNLRATSDLLLPKLISGKLDVEDLDIDVGEPIETLEEATA